MFKRITQISLIAVLLLVFVIVVFAQSQPITKTQWLPSLLVGKVDTVPSGLIAIWPGDEKTIPDGWSIFQPAKGRFLLVASETFTPGMIGGASEVDLSHAHNGGTLATNSAGQGFGDTITKPSYDPTFTVDTNGDGKTISVMVSTHRHSIPGTIISPCHDHRIQSGETEAALEQQDILPPYFTVILIQKD